ncbi:MAG: hypothetical protein A2Y12_00590 [Planctomycetes bacterium GWF2_42_9]|nr:MAG: hypothetical protein A2Y12_00590 [Planctomycetes bacterium GWF2_42_9]
MTMVRDVVHIQEKQGSSFISFKFDLTYPEFYKGVRERAEPGTTMICGSFGYGDMLMLTPTLRALKELLPENPVHLYCGPNEYYIAKNNPNVDLLVAVPFNFTNRSPRRTFAHLCTAYDRAFCLWGIIAQNPKAELVNAYEVIAQKIGVKLRLFIPEYYPLPTEIELARQTLETSGITPGKDKIAVIQPKSTSLLRTLPIGTLETLLYQLENNGWKTIVFWDNTNLPEKASRFGYWTSRDFQHLTLRELLALVTFSNIVIATDSMISHLAAAMNIPSVLLYGPIQATLRSLHFPKAYSLQADVTCGPCFQHGNRCAIQKNGISPCMRRFSAESIMNAVNSVLSPNYHPIIQESSNFKLELEGMKCRMCGCEAMMPYVRKKDTLYFKCAKCDTVQTHTPNSGQDIFVLPKHQFIAGQNKKTIRYAAKTLMILLPTVRKLVYNNGCRSLLLDFGYGEALACKMLKAINFDVEIFESDPIQSQQPQTQYKHWTDLDQLISSMKNGYDAITMLNSLQYIMAMDVVFPKIVNCLKANGWLILTLFSMDNIVYFRHTPIIEAEGSGGIPLIPSETGLDIFMARFGLRRIWFSKIPKQTSSLFVYQKEEQNVIEKKTRI